MRQLRLPVLCIGLFIAFCGMGVADTEWETVALDNDPAFTIDVPATAGNDYKPGKGSGKGDLMFIDVTSNDGGAMYCMLGRSKYPKGIGPKTFARKFATRARDTLCTAVSGPDISGMTVDQSEALTSNGRPAARCLVAYTNQSQEDPGWVESVLTIAGSRSVYQLNCAVRAEEVEAAEVYWSDHWSNVVDHIEQSLHLPETEK